MADCPHTNVYLDDFLGEWHCDDCGASFGDTPPPKADDQKATS